MKTYMKTYMKTLEGRLDNLLKNGACLLKNSVDAILYRNIVGYYYDDKSGTTPFTSSPTFVVPKNGQTKMMVCIGSGGGGGYYGSVPGAGCGGSESSAPGCYPTKTYPSKFITINHGV